MVSVSLREGGGTAGFEGGIGAPILIRRLLDPSILNNYQSVSNLPFRENCGKGGQIAAAEDLGGNGLSRPVSGWGIVLLYLLMIFWQNWDWNGASIFVLLDLSVTCSTIYHGILLDQQHGLRLGRHCVAVDHSFLSGWF